MALYTPEILTLATGLADFPLAGDFALRATARSRTCGSVIELGLDCDKDAQISGVGMRVAACAIGQASAAIMAQAANGRPAAELAEMHPRLAAWLAGETAIPQWPGIAVLAPALTHKGRHGALLLPWMAAREALCSVAARR